MIFRDRKLRPERFAGNCRKASPGESGFICASSVEEEHVAIFRERPALVGDAFFKRIHRRAQCLHRSDYRRLVVSAQRTFKRGYAGLERIKFRAKFDKVFLQCAGAGM